MLYNALIKQFLKQFYFSYFPSTLLTMPKKFYIDKILLHVPVTLDKARKYPAYYTSVIYPWPCAKSSGSSG